LLINNKKHDLRLYVLITSVEPFNAYLCDEGLARFCVEDYEVPSAENKNIRQMHLTNYSITKNSSKFVRTEEIDRINDGSKQTLSSYYKTLECLMIDTQKVQFLSNIGKRVN